MKGGTWLSVMNIIYEYLYIFNAQENSIMIDFEHKVRKIYLLSRKSILVSSHKSSISIIHLFPTHQRQHQKTQQITPPFPKSPRNYTKRDVSGLPLKNLISPTGCWYSFLNPLGQSPPADPQISISLTHWPTDPQ